MASPRNRRIRRQRFLAALTTGFLLAGVAGAVADGGSPTPNSAGPAPTGSDPGGLGLPLGGLLGGALGATELPARKAAGSHEPTGQAVGGAGVAEQVAAGLAEGWARLRDDAAALAKAGIAVVAPAGDLGPGPQSVLGVAGLPEVVTVGAADRDGVAPASA